MQNLLEVHVLELEMNFDDSGGFHSCPQDILLRGSVVFGTQPIKVVEEAFGRKIKDNQYTIYELRI